MLEVLSNPEFYGKSITEKCEIAGVNRLSYYKMIQRPGFIEYLNQLNYELIKARIGDVIDACYKFATTEKSCHSDRKILLQMAGFYKDEQNINVSKQTEVCDATEDELRAALSQLNKMKAIDVEPVEEDKLEK